MRKNVWSEVTYLDYPNGKCFWAVLDAEGSTLDSREAPNRKKAYAESAQSCKLLDRGKHINSPKAKR